MKCIAHTDAYVFNFDVDCLGATIDFHRGPSNGIYPRTPYVLYVTSIFMTIICTLLLISLYCISEVLLVSLGLGIKNVKHGTLDPSSPKFFYSMTSFSRPPLILLSVNAAIVNIKPICTCGPALDHCGHWSEVVYAIIILV